MYRAPPAKGAVRSMRPTNHEGVVTFDFTQDGCE
jgi:hypothetical protein